MIPLIVLRPEPGCAATVAAAGKMGLAASGFPLFEVVPRSWEPVDPAQFDGLLAGSANAFRAGGPGLAALRRLPVHAVGKETARVAQDCGFTLASIGEGGLQAVLEGISGAKRLLRLAGEERVQLLPPPGITLTERIVYASVARPLAHALAELLKRPAIVLLHSGEAARHFAAECARLGIDKRLIRIAALAPRIAGAAGTGWASIDIAAQPQDAALLALARDLCQDRTAD